MKKWLVTMPIAGSVSFEVETENGADESDAIDAAWKKFHTDGVDDSTLEYDVLETIAEGNVCHAPVNEAYADEIEEG